MKSEYVEILRYGPYIFGNSTASEWRDYFVDYLLHPNMTIVSKKVATMHFKIVR